MKKYIMIIMAMALLFASDCWGESGVYTIAKEQLGLGNYDLSGDVFKVMLLKSTHVFDADGDEDVADIVANECSGGYARGTLDGVTWTVTGNNWKWDATNETFSNITEDVAFIVVYNDDIADELVFCLDLQATYSVSGQDFTAFFSSLGMVQLD